jgi:hypothetical protein
MGDETELDKVDACQDRAEDLTEWEMAYLDSLKTRLSSGNDITINQADKLDEIYERLKAQE